MVDTYSSTHSHVFLGEHGPTLRTAVPELEDNAEIAPRLTEFQHPSPICLQNPWQHTTRIVLTNQIHKNGNGFRIAILIYRFSYKT
jgi:hypothetical protein